MPYGCFVQRSITLSRLARCGESVDIGNKVGGDIIDSIHLLDTKSLHVLSLTFGMLVRASQHGCYE